MAEIEEMNGARELIRAKGWSTWKLLTIKGTRACVRSYNEDGTVEKENMFAVEAESLRIRCQREDVSNFSKVPVTNKRFWYEQIQFRNFPRGHGSKKSRLLREFKNQCAPAIDSQDPKALGAVFKKWIASFERCIVLKKEFNHWDNDSAERVRRDPYHSGIGWTAKLLEHSRAGRQIRFIETGNELTDFALLAMELNLGISSRNNAFRHGETDGVYPDGLAIRKDNGLTIFEVKGPQDEDRLKDPMLQAVCGALAVYARRDNVQEIARAGGVLRPKCPKARIPKGKPNLGIHVLTAGRNLDGRKRLKEKLSDVEEPARLILQACPKLKYIAFSVASRKHIESPGQLPVDLVIPREDVTM